MSGRVYAIAADTSAELAYVRDCLIAAGAPVTTVDVGTAGPPTMDPDIPRERLQADPAELSSETVAVAAMSRLTSFMRAEHAAGEGLA
ncbi:MAG: hypothetical protein U0992_11250 [Planctomycetaceae bacterium]